MNTNKLFRMSLLAPLALALAACGGGGGGDGGPVGDGGYENVPSNPNQLLPGAQTKISDVESLTGVGAGETKDFRSASALGLITEHQGNTTARSTSGYVGVRTEGAYGHKVPVTMAFDADNNGQISKQMGSHDAFHDIEDHPDGVPQYTVEEVNLGNAKVVKAMTQGAHRNGVIYVSKDAAQKVYAGMATYHNQDSGGAYGIFGTDTTGAQMSALRNEQVSSQNGGASYRGVSSASVRIIKSDGSGGIEHYVGTANGNVDFVGNTINASTTMQHDGRGINQANIPNQVIVVTENEFSGNGSSFDGTQTMTATGFDDNKFIKGDSRGGLYGPDGDTLGVTFDGNGYGGDLGIAGGMLMNKD